MSNTWHIPIKFIFYIFKEFKLKIYTPLVRKGIDGGWMWHSNYV